LSRTYFYLEAGEGSAEQIDSVKLSTDEIKRFPFVLSLSKDLISASLKGQCFYPAYFYL